METTGEPLRIHTSETCRALLQQIGGYQLEERGNIEVGAVIETSRNIYKI